MKHVFPWHLCKIQQGTRPKYPTVCVCVCVCVRVSVCVCVCTGARLPPTTVHNTLQPMHCDTVTLCCFGQKYEVPTPTTTPMMEHTLLHMHASSAAPWGNLIGGDTAPCAADSARAGSSKDPFPQAPLRRTACIVPTTHEWAGYTTWIYWMCRTYHATVLCLQLCQKLPWADGFGPYGQP